MPPDSAAVHKIPATPGLKRRAGYLPSLDGWRAIAIIGVLLVHETTIAIHGVSLQLVQGYGSLGVVLFFAISGILIPWRILEEESLTGRFHLRQFYIRRLFRIQPAAIAYLLTVAVLILCGVIFTRWKYWFGGLFLYENFLYRPNPVVDANGFFVGHFWTLAVEEHFYLLISFAFFFVRRRRAWMFGLALLAIKVAQSIAMAHVPDPLLRRTYWQIHMLLWPTFAAVLLRKPAVHAWASRYVKPLWILPGTFLLAFLMNRLSPTHTGVVFGWLFTLWVISTMLHPQSWTTRVLEWRPLRFLGRISYSLYLWHVLFYHEFEHIPLGSHVLIALSSKPWKYLCALTAAIASYYLIERPFIRLGHRLAPPATAGHRDLADLPVLQPDSSGAARPTM